MSRIEKAVRALFGLKVPLSESGEHLALLCAIDEGKQVRKAGSGEFHVSGEDSGCWVFDKDGNLSKKLPGPQEESVRGHGANRKAH